MSSSRYFGWCKRCNSLHFLQEGAASGHARALMAKLSEEKRIDFHNTSTEEDSRFRTDYLFGSARGQMFGVMVCANNFGDEVVLQAFSGQYNGVWLVDGWAPPLFDLQRYHQIMDPGDVEIKKMGKKLSALNHEQPQYQELKLQRKRLSQSIMKKLHGLYEIQNFHGDSMPMINCFELVKGPPSGAGDCCAPKLLNHAVREGLRPLSMVEFYWGKTNPSQTRKQGLFYDSCRDKCQPILGFMLCGVGK